jgi:bidirectional [NiFe] hydrogenase diaphorase subunit
MIHLTINSKKVKAKKESTLLEICRKMSIPIPTLCYHPDLTPHGSCRLCTVEVSKNGKTRMVTACNYFAQEGIDVQTHSDRVIQIRRTLVELFLARCPKVPMIQNLGKELGIEKKRFTTQNPENDCILCGLCIRTCNEIVGANAIGFSKRGTFKKIGTPFEIDSDQCIACGACEYICPTGAIKMEMTRINKIKFSDTGVQRYCRYMRLGLVDFMICSNGFECWRCEVDQRMEDRFGIHPAFILKPAGNKQACQISGFTFYPEFFYSEEHIWAKPIDQHIRLGFDDIVSVFAADAESIRLPPVGSNLLKDGILAEITTDGKKATLYSPLTGIISVVNRDVMESPNLAWKDPYRRGWLLMIRPGPLEDISRLYSGEKARGWFTQQVQNLVDLLDEWNPNPSKKDKVLEGQWFREIIRERWDRLTEILLKGRDKFETRNSKARESVKRKS